MVSRIKLGDIAVDVILKDIKNVHLSVYPPTGRVRISAPRRMRLETIRVFAIAKLDWIKRQQRRLREQERETPREHLDRESHYVWGKRFLLKVVEDDLPPNVQIRHGVVDLCVRPRTSQRKRSAVIAAWYRQLLKAALPPLIRVWEPRLSVSVSGFFVQQMKTRWGSCNPVARTIRLNTELAKKPMECLEYVVVHEMVHLLERQHNRKFLSHMDRALPHWRSLKDMLNNFPLRHEEWEY
jgi:predicted metal-dependent hydrolase